MIRECSPADFPVILEIINESAESYRGAIPLDCWKEPYMSAAELRHETEQGVRFLGCEEGGQLVGVMGSQDVQDVTLIRHAYVRTILRNRGIGGALISVLRRQTPRPVLVGTWAAATWAIGFYERYGFLLVPQPEKDRLLKRYWSIPERQIEMSVVLAEMRWFRQRA